jgi:hypothetical protein
VLIVGFEDTSVAKEISASVEKEPILLHCTVPVLYIDYFQNFEVFFAVRNFLICRTYLVKELICSS